MPNISQVSLLMNLHEALLTDC